MTVKEKLEAYRRKKHKEKMIETIRNTIRNTFSWNRYRVVGKTDETSIKEEEVQLCEESENVQDVADAQETCSNDNTQESNNTVITVVTYLLYFSLWVALYTIAVKYEFGAIYFILSAFVFIWFNTSSEPKRRDELSAYSVFNPNCEAIQGTLDEKEMRYGLVGML